MRIREKTPLEIEEEFFFNFMIDFMKYKHPGLFKKYLRLKHEDRKNMMIRSIQYRLNEDPDILCLIPISVFDKLEIKYKLYDGKDLKINKLIKKLGCRAKCVFI